MSRKQLLIRLLILLGAVALVAALAAFKIYTDAEHALSVEISKAKDDRIWVYRLSDLDPVGPESQNGAAVYAQAIGQFRARRSEVAPSSQASAACLALAKKASLYPFFRSSSSGDQHTLAQAVDELQQDLLLRVDQEVSSRSASEALDDLIAAARMAHQLAMCPQIDVTAGEYDKRVFARLGPFLQHFPRMASQASAVVDALGEPTSMVPKMRLQMYIIFQELGKPLTSVSACTSGDEALCHDVWLSKWPYFRLKYQTGAVRFYRRAIEEVQQSPRPSRNASFMARFEVPGSERGIEGEHLFFAPPWLGREARSYSVSIALRRVMRQSIAILCLPKLPDALPLTGDWAIDPSNDRPLHYVRTKEGFKVYGLGPTGGDFGGNDSGLASDIVFEFPAAKLGTSDARPMKNSASAAEIP